MMLAKFRSVHAVGGALLWALALCGQLSSRARADQDVEDDATAAKARERTYVNARVGFASSDANHMPQVCVEVAPLAYLSVEACGTGAQVWHNRPLPEMSHYLLKGRVLSLPLPHFVLQAFVAAGFTELSVGADQAGFVFRGVSEGRASTAGGEIGASIRALYPMSKGFDLLADASFLLAYLPHAEELVSSRSRVQPSVSFSMGLGF